MNIEFETKRKFYYYSDKFIDTMLFPITTDYPPPLKRLVTILDNRGVFIEWLSRCGVCFVEDNRLPLDDDILKADPLDRPSSLTSTTSTATNTTNDITTNTTNTTTTQDTTKYLGWWNRLRNTKLKDNSASLTLIRYYSQSIDRDSTLHKMINKAEYYAAHSLIDPNPDPDDPEAVTLDSFDMSIEDCVLDMLANINDNDHHEAHKALKQRKFYFHSNVKKKHRRIKNRLLGLTGVPPIDDPPAESADGDPHAVNPADSPPADARPGREDSPPTNPHPQDNPQTNPGGGFVDERLDPRANFMADKGGDDT
ncbi:MAG: hypothetical protein LBE35_09160 [Clostridiales bacterium]|nr:hypothetical protein [Clostridiales bacterium]